MRFELFIAARYLRAKRRQAVVGVITIISVIGVTAGVASLIIALAIKRLELIDLLLDLRQLLRSSRIQAIVVTIARGPASLHHRDEELSAGEHCANVDGFHSV